MVFVRCLHEIRRQYARVSCFWSRFVFGEISTQEKTMAVASAATVPKKLRQSCENCISRTKHFWNLTVTRRARALAASLVAKGRHAFGRRQHSSCRLFCSQAITSEGAKLASCAFKARWSSCNTKCGEMGWHVASGRASLLSSWTGPV